MLRVLHPMQTASVVPSVLHVTSHAVSEKGDVTGPYQKAKEGSAHACPARSPVMPWRQGDLRSWRWGSRRRGWEGSGWWSVTGSEHKGHAAQTTELRRTTHPHLRKLSSGANAARRDAGATMK